MKLNPTILTSIFMITYPQPYAKPLNRSKRKLDIDKGRPIFLRHNTSKCPIPVKSYCYQTYVRPTLKMLLSSGTPPPNKTSTNLKWPDITQITLHSDWWRHSSPTVMTQILNWQCPEHHRHTAMFTECTMYTILHGFS